MGELVVGKMVLAERKGGFAEAEVVGQSKKKQGQCVVRFESDGKCIAKSLSSIKEVSAPSNTIAESSVGNMGVQQLQSAAEPVPVPSSSTPPTSGLSTGMQVEAERKGGFAVAEAVGQSKKKEGQWVVRFESDGKCIAKTTEQIRQF